MKSNVRRPAIPPHIVALPTAQAPLVHKRSHRLWPYGVAIVGVFVVAVFGYGLYARPWATKPIAVLVEVAEPGPVTRAIAVNGRIAAKTMVDVRPSVLGRIVAMSGDQGDFVDFDDVLAQQDGVTLRAVVRQAFSSLDAGIIRRQQAQATVASDTALGGNVAQSKLLANTRLLAEAESEVDRLNGLLEQAQSQLALLTITSPMAGTIVSRSVEIGEVVDSQTVLFAIADLAHLVVRTDVDELYAAQVRLGQSALLLPTGQTGALPGSVSKLSPLIDEATGGMAIELSFTTPQMLPLGMTVTANIVIEQSPDALTVPRGAIVSGSSLYLLRAGKAVLVPVTSIDWPADRFVVTKGLAAGDVVITTPVGLSDGVGVVADQD